MQANNQGVCKIHSGALTLILIHLQRLKILILLSAIMSSPKRKGLEITSSLISYRKLSIALRKTHQKGLYIGADLELKVTRASFTIKMEQHYDLLFYPERLKVKGGGSR
jgi:hypothetical protein